jgi:UDP-glucose:(heptosyl)LPS alpha-1,3-glucosyltransferase
MTSADGPRPKAFRIAFVIQRYFAFGGLQRDLLRTALACAEREHEVHVLTEVWEGPRPDPIQLHVLHVTGWTNHARRRTFAQSVARYAATEHFDCIVGFNKIPGLDVYWAGDLCLAERLRQKKNPFLPWLPRYRTYLQLESAVFSDASDAELLILAEAEKARFVRHYRTRESRIHLMPPGIDRRRFSAIPSDGPSKAAFRAELGIAPLELVILMVGSGFKTKGVDRAIHAVASLPGPERRRARLVIVGNGSARPFQRLARRLQIDDRVLFTGGRDDIASFYGSADFLLHPARTEMSGNSLLESMLCGLPVLVTENCGNSVYVKRANAGLICPEPFAQQQLNRLLAQMLPLEARQIWRRNALTYCSRLDLDALLKRTVEIIEARARRNRLFAEQHGANRASESGGFGERA